MEIIVITTLIAAAAYPALNHLSSCFNFRNPANIIRIPMNGRI